ncbi:major facilitator superfamily domain-containing protein [Crucibulum laeve]|uniref:Major facilitator superfamily domain-containing protein n=1 Tax=Crucibulum laeve TaxID=68775 RepID=A0A5C3LPU5_9AGAR|nr:major facilitator superfamily domain-containing protein [Crucibulum laeve]
MMYHICRIVIISSRFRMQISRDLFPLLSLSIVRGIYSRGRGYGFSNIQYGFHLRSVSSHAPYLSAAECIERLTNFFQLLTSIVGNHEQVGYYAGLMESIRQLISFITVMYWSRLSDLIGRKPILLLGTSALAVSMFSFGLSKTFWGLVISRCVFTAFNSNAGVIKGTVGEITDPSNSADAFALLHIPWAVGTSIGSLLGGSLAQPHKHFPVTFQSPFWVEYPYFLPCLATAGLASVGVFFLICFKETVPGTLLYGNSGLIPGDSEVDEEQSLLVAPSGNLSSSAAEEAPTPLRELLSFRILLPTLNYVSLSFLHTSSNSLQPLFLAMPIDIGGLGLDPTRIGYILGAYGAASTIFQTFFLAKLVRRFGVKRVFTTAIMVFLPMFFLSPVMNMLAKRKGISGPVWCLLIIQLAFSLAMELGYGCIYMYITSASPNKRSLGAINGLAQTLVSISRILAPALASSLLSLSIQHNILGGYLVYLVLGLVVVGCIMLAGRLPRDLWQER